MNTFLIFMMLCLILGLWIKPRVRYGIILITIGVFLLVIYLWIRPSQL